MDWNLSVAAAGFAALVAGASALAAVVRSGPPSGRLSFAFLAGSAGLVLFWLAAFLGRSELLLSKPFQTLVILALLALSPLMVTVSTRLGQQRVHFLAGGAGPAVLAAVMSIALGVWVFRGTASSLQSLDSGAFVLALAPGPARAVAVALLLSGCFAILRFQAALEAARRAGSDRLGRALVGPLFATIALVLTTSQLLLYGSLPLELVGLGSVVLVPTLLAVWPLLLHGENADAMLPESARLETSGLLLLGLGLFLVALAALGQIVHEFFPDRGLLWFRYGGTALLIAFALASLLPAIRGPLSDYFDRNLYAQKWDFRHEWHRSNRACKPVSSVPQLVVQARDFVEDVLGPTAVAIWTRSENDELVPRSSGSVALTALAPENPLRRLVEEDRDVVDLVVDRPHRFAELPAVVENIHLVEAAGFRIFLGLRHDDVCFAILGVAPPEGFRLDREHRVLLRNFGDQLANTLWYALRSGREETAVQGGGVDHG